MSLASNVLQRGSRTASVAALCWIALGLDSILRPAQINARDTWWMLPFLLTTGAFWLVHSVQASRTDWLERAAFYTLMIASALVFAGSIGIQAEQPALAALGFPGGAVIWAAGLMVFGVATLRAAVFPRFVGIALLLLEPGSILTGLALAPISPLHDRGSYSAGVEKGLALALVSYGFVILQERSPALNSTVRLLQTEA
jgi:hypothetical protein